MASENPNSLDQNIGSQKNEHKANFNKSNQDLQSELKHLLQNHHQLMVTIINDSNSEKTKRLEVKYLWDKVFSRRNTLLNILKTQKFDIQELTAGTILLLSPPDAALWKHYLTTPIPELTLEALHQLVSLQQMINNLLQCITILCCNTPPTLTIHNVS